MTINNVKNRDEWLIGCCNKDILKDKDYLITSVIKQMLNKTIRIFKYNNLPETIKQKDLEIYLQVGGFAIFKEVEGKLYCFQGSLGGEPNPYYLPTLAIIANPALRYNASLKIGEECIVMTNDYLYQGLMPLFRKYGHLLVEAELSLKYAILNARVPALVQADNDTTAESAKKFFEKIYNGEDYGIIVSNEFLEGIKSQDFYQQPHVKELIEAVQYIKGSWYNEIGLNSTFNMKRESINEAEASLNEDILKPLIDVMLDCRQTALDEVNKMFGTNITIELDSVWATNQLQDDLILEEKEANIEALEKHEEVEVSEDNRDADTARED